jgi:MFS family permease
MNSGSALAAIISPVVGGWLIDRTGNWNLPFTVSMILMAAGIILSFTMRPDRALEVDEEKPGTTPARKYV